MFDQPPLTAKEDFGRGLIHGFALLLATFLLTLISMLPSRYRLYLGPGSSVRSTLLFTWPLFVTIGCVVLLFRKDERTTAYRAGVLATYVLFLAICLALWAMKF